MPIADEQPVAVVVLTPGFFRDSLCRLLQERSLTVSGVAGSLADGVCLSFQVTAPDVVVFDLDLAGRDPVSTRRAVRALADIANVVVLTPPAGVSADEEVDLIFSGAAAHVQKSATVDRLCACVESAARGDAVFELGRNLGHHRRATVDGKMDEPELRANTLSPRELDVLELIAAGYGNAEIANELSVSPRTVKNHVSSILSKLGFHNRTQAAVYAVKVGIVSSRDPGTLDGSQLANQEAGTGPRSANDERSEECRE